MRRFYISSFIGYFLYILISFSPAYGVGEYGGVWSDTLNFTHHTLKLRTGANGNITVLSEDGKTENLFDVNQVHRNLQQHVKDLKHTTGEHNVVVVGLTLVVKLGEDRYQAFYQLLNDEKGLPIAFVSGSVPRSFSNKKYTFVRASDEFKPTDLLESFEDRLRGITEQQLLPEEIGSYVQIWRKNLQEPLEKAKSQIHGLLKAPYPSVLELDDAIKPALIEACQQSNERFGSSTDSEQFFLQLLSRDTKPMDSQPLPRLVHECRKLRGAYHSQKLDFFKHSLFNTEDLTVLIQGTENLQRELIAFKDAQEVGYMLHFHSTRELCRCCACSISKDLVYGQLAEAVKQIVVERNGGSNVDPFFLVLSSSSQMLGDKESHESNYKRQGIGKANRLKKEVYLDESVIIDDIIESRLFLQMFLPEHSSYSAQTDEL